MQGIDVRSVGNYVVIQDMAIGGEAWGDISGMAKSSI